MEEVKLGQIEATEILFKRAAQFREKVMLNNKLSLKHKAILQLIEAYEGLVSVDVIRSNCTDGVSSVRSGLNELEELGAIEKIRERDEETGRWTTTRYKIKLYQTSYDK
jgi:ribosomal protein S19E (S16A)